MLKRIFSFSIQKKQALHLLQILVQILVFIMGPTAISSINNENNDSPPYNFNCPFSREKSKVKGISFVFYIFSLCLRLITITG